MFSDIRVRDENTPALQSGKTYTTPGLQPQRKKGLSDITNNQGLTPKLGTTKKAPASSRTAFRNITNTGLGQDENKGLGVLPGKKAKGTLADRSKHNGVPADLKRTAQLYALQGVEHVHMTGRQMEAMMAEKQEEEIQQRVATVLAFRTDMPSLLPSGRLSPFEIADAPMRQEVEPPAPDESWDHGLKPHTSTLMSSTWGLDASWVDPLEGCRNDWDLGVLDDEDIEQRYAHSLASN